MYTKALSLILNTPWAIDEKTALDAYPIIENLLENKPAGLSVQGAAPYFTNTHTESGAEQTVKVIPIKGVLVKDDGYCTMGMAGIGRAVRQAAEDDNTAGIVLLMDTPGGTVDGTKVLADTIAQAREKKPVIAFIDGQCASAGLRLASEASYIIADTEFAQVGSVGILTNFADMQPLWEKRGTKFHTIVADQSKDKGRLFQELKKGNYKEYKEKVLNPLAEDFRQAIKKNRPKVTDDMLTGSMYFAKDVIGSFVDEIGSFDYALQKATSNNFQPQNKTNRR